MKIIIEGENAGKIAHTLGRKLTELGRVVHFEGEKALVLKAAAEEDALRYQAEEFDSPDFASDKVLDLLEERGVVDLDQQVSEEEEEAIRARLQNLGYIE